MRAMPECCDSRSCFAKNCGFCRILRKTYRHDGDCPFCKEVPWAHDWTKTEKEEFYAMKGGA